MSFFARYSKRARAHADRILFNANNVDPAIGRGLSTDVAVDLIKQAQAGVAYLSGGLAFYAKGF